MLDCARVIDNCEFDYFQLPCPIEQLVFDWVRLLGVPLDTPGLDDQVGGPYGKPCHSKTKRMDQEQQGSNTLAPNFELPNMTLCVISKQNDARSQHVLRC